jgi:hypothetical protein
MTKERYNSLKNWLIETALQFYSMNGIFKSAEEKEEWYKIYQKEEVLVKAAMEVPLNKKEKKEKK